MKILLICLISFNLYAGPTKVGNGDDGTDLEGFELVDKGIFLESRDEALKLLYKLNTNGIIGLGNLIPELTQAKMYVTSKDVSSKKLEELGAFHSGMEGLIYARTFARPYAPTRFFPAASKLSKSQLMALHIHEALHRSLPESVREDEKVVTKITLSIISPEQSSDSILSTVKEAIPELFLTSPNQIKINKNSKLQSPSSLEFSISKWTSSKRNFSNGFSLPLDRAYNVAAEFYPFGEKASATGFGISTSYLFTERRENYFGPLELTVRHLEWTERGYDFEFKGGIKLMSSSNSKVKDSIYGYDSFIVGVESNKITDEYKFKLGLDIITGKEFSRSLNNINTQYKVGAIYELYGSIFIPWEQFEFGANASILSLSSLKAVQNSSNLIDKERDQYFKAGPEIKYKYKNDFTFSLDGEYLFNSNLNNNEDHLRDLFGNGLGQWKWSLKITKLFY